MAKKSLRKMFPSGQLPDWFKHQPTPAPELAGAACRIDGRSVEDLLGSDYYFMGLDVTATVVAVDVPAGTITVDSSVLRSPRALSIEAFERSISVGFTVRQ